MTKIMQLLHQEGFTQLSAYVTTEENAAIFTTMVTRFTVNHSTLSKKLSHMNNMTSSPVHNFY